MSVKMKPTSYIIADLGLGPNGRVQKYFTQRCAVHMDKYVPYKKGRLRRYKTEDKAVKYNMPYAHYIYEGILYVDPETGSPWARKDVTKIPTGRKLTYHLPGTGAHWDKLMWSAEKKQVLDEVQNYMRRK